MAKYGSHLQFIAALIFLVYCFVTGGESYPVLITLGAFPAGYYLAEFLVLKKRDKSHLLPVLCYLLLIAFWALDKLLSDNLLQIKKERKSALFLLQ